MTHPHEHLMGVRFQQSSAEVRALQRQAYALATLRLRDAVTDHGGGAGLAIVSDIDETILDNSAVMALAAHQDGPMFENLDTWKLWERDGDPHLIPGAADFFALADRLGVTIFYVSDRFEENKLATIATLSKLGLPQVRSEQVLLFGPPKAERRAMVERNHRVILHLGDTLHDFHEAFAGTPLDDQHRMADDHADRFGQDWIIFPNAAHGSWMRAELRPWIAPGG
ncbi:5'-nucleotidase, lipoprotein e(P4) family [Paracoccus sp. (in: a-proteobacteria)]|uniref:5'-nucleotidase, lipoprotein e(P4) family n=1 Tax=Paracoccus sp. TaxID=267 RepID=UPI0026E0E852|nr:HAD family acid phosphatase [Paracoccus sp. (in: a-proteobacteria)]MDO5647125.1 HAD family acid phosphatase [Paracoccus sp. (in: a-proteobacteria)]